MNETTVETTIPPNTLAKPGKPKPKLTLRDTTDLLGLVNAYVEDHVDEIEFNGGALPDDLAALLDEIVAGRMERVDAIAAKLDELTGYASAAKATKDRAARRQKVWDNTIAAIKAYAFREVERGGGGFIRGTVSTLRIQRNGQPSTDLSAPPGAEHTLKVSETHNLILIGIHEQELSRRARVAEDKRLADGLGIDPGMTGVQIPAAHPLAPFITVQRVATLDRRGLGAAYEARRADLEAESELIGESDIDAEVLAAMGPDDATRQRDLPAVVARMRQRYVANSLANEFPGVSCTRGSHLRID